MKRHTRTALKETWLILITWCVFCAWVIGVCANHYQPPASIAATDPASRSEAAEELVTIGGLPSWVFWGIAVPWMVATTFTVGFAVGGLAVDPEAEEEAEERNG